MPRTITTLLVMATLSAAAPLLAQSAYSAGPDSPETNATPGYTESYTQQPAPIERSYADGGAQHAPSPQTYQAPRNQTSQPAQGIWLVTAPGAAVQTVSATADHTELRVERGQANVNIHHPADHSEIVVDLPAGQVSLVKDGLYTFNADTNTVRVLHGEAVIASSAAETKGHETKVKEDHEFTFGPDARAHEASPDQLRADLLQGNYGDGGGYRHGDGYGFYGYPYAYGWPYYGFWGPGWGYPYYAFGPWGYPYGYGVGIGFGYYGGFRGGFAYRG